MNRLIVFLLPFLFVSPCLAEKINIACLLSEDSYYVREMEMGFRAQLKDEGLLEGQNIRYTWVRGANAPGDWSSCEDLVKQVNRPGIQLIVSFGTLSSIGAFKCIRPGTTPLVFAGVTDPVGSGLLTSLDRPSANGITGIIYGMPSVILFRFIRSVLPKTARLGLLHDASFPHDTHYKSILEKSGIPKGTTLEYIPIDEKASIPEKYQKDNYVFIGWYGMYRHLKKLVSRYPDAVFIGSNISMLEQGALAVISPADRDIGKDAAQIAADILLRKKEITAIPPRQPSRFVIGVNLGKARELKLDIPEKVIAIADEVIK